VSAHGSKRPVGLTRLGRGFLSRLAAQLLIRGWTDRTRLRPEELVISAYQRANAHCRGRRHQLPPTIPRSPGIIPVVHPAAEMRSGDTNPRCSHQTRHRMRCLGQMTTARAGSVGQTSTSKANSCNDAQVRPNGKPLDAGPAAASQVSAQTPANAPQSREGKPPCSIRNTTASNPGLLAEYERLR
jgi:hypothetical protein